MGHPPPDELVLAAVTPSEVSGDVSAHIGGCDACSAEVEALQRTMGLARGHGPVQDPPPAVWDRVVEELGPELAAPPPRSGRGRMLLAAAAALVVGLAAGVTIGARLGGEETVAGPPLTALTAGVTGTADLDENAGDAVLAVSVEEASVPADGYLEVWLTDSGVTRLQAIGALRRDGAAWTGRFVLPEGLPLDQLDTVDVSLEHYDGDPTHSGDSLLRGRLP